MKNKMMKFGVPSVMVIAAAMFYFSALDQVKAPSVSKETYNVNAFNTKANPYVGVKVPSSDEVYVEIAAQKQDEMPEVGETAKKTYFRPGSFDHKRIDKQAVKNQRMAVKAMERNELKIIEREIASDEMRLQELMQKGDSENANYLENLIAQKRARFDELKYQ